MRDVNTAKQLLWGINRLLKALLATANLLLAQSEWINSAYRLSIFKPTQDFLLKRLLNKSIHTDAIIYTKTFIYFIPFIIHSAYAAHIAKQRYKMKLHDIFVVEVHSAQVFLFRSLKQTEHGPLLSLLHCITQSVQDILLLWGWLNHLRQGLKVTWNETLWHYWFPQRR